MPADGVPEAPPDRRAVQRLLPFPAASTRGLLCRLIGNGAGEGSGPLPSLSERLYNLGSAFIKGIRSPVLPKSINDESLGGRDPLNAFFHWSCKLQNPNYEWVS